ncbi:hypothetical protein L9F63_004586, partial [Diploptera punctata]
EHCFLLYLCSKKQCSRMTEYRSRKLLIMRTRSKLLQRVNLPVRNRHVWLCKLHHHYQVAFHQTMGRASRIALTVSSTLATAYPDKLMRTGGHTGEHMDGCAVVLLTVLTSVRRHHVTAPRQPALHNNKKTLVLWKNETEENCSFNRFSFMSYVFLSVKERTLNNHIFEFYTPDCGFNYSDHNYFKPLNLVFMSSRDTRNNYIINSQKTKFFKREKLNIE